MSNRRELPGYMRAGAFFDFSRPSGVIRLIVAVFFCFLFIWNAHHVFDWVYSVLGIESTPDSEGTVRVRRFFAGLMFGITLFSGVIKLIWLFSYRKKSIKSSRGQWYDNSGLSKDDLYDSEQRKDD